jgi:hypothetical protein
MKKALFFLLFTACGQNPQQFDSRVVLGAEGGYLIFGCQTNAQGDISCPTNAQVVDSNMTKPITGIVSGLNYFYVNSTGADPEVAQCSKILKKGDTPACDLVRTYTNHDTISPALSYKNYLYMVGLRNPFLTACEINPNGSLAQNCSSDIKGLPTNIELSGITNFKNDIYISSMTSTIYKCTEMLRRGSLDCSETLIPKYNTTLGMSFHTLHNKKTLMYLGLYNEGMAVFSLDKEGNFTEIQKVNTASLVNNLMNIIHENNLYISSGTFITRCALNPDTGKIQVNTCTPQGNGSYKFDIQGVEYVPTTLSFYPHPK